MGHHVPALLPPVIQPLPKTEKPRWRPRVGTRKEGAEAPQETDEVYNVPTALEEKRPHRAKAPRQGAASEPYREGGVAQSLTDDTLRTVLAGQEDILNGTG